MSKKMTTVLSRYKSMPSLKEKQPKQQREKNEFQNEAILRMIQVVKSV